MRSTLFAANAALLALLAAACGDSGSPATQDAAPQGTATAKADAGAAEQKSAPRDGAAAQDPGPAAQPAAPLAEPKLVSGGRGGPAMLDTGIDLSHLKDTSAPSEFPAKLDPIAPQVPPGFGTPSGPPGAMELVQGDEISDFGELLEGEKQDVTYRLKSAGENPLHIERVKPSCGCTATNIELVAADGTRSVYQLGAPIPPGVELQLGATINTAGRAGLFASNIAIYSNDPASPMRLQLKANVKPVLEISPQNLDFGMMTSGDTKEGMVTISTAVLDAYHLELEATNVTEHLSAELTPIDPDAEGRAKTWELAVKLGPDTPEGMRRYQLRLKSDIPVADRHEGHDHAAGEDDHADELATKATRELFCNVMANVTALVVATPNFISLGVVRPGEPIERTVKIESLDPSFTLPAQPAHRFQSISGGELTGAEYFSLAVAPTPGAEGNSLDVTLRLDGLPDDYQGSFGGMVTLDIGHPTKPEVNVRFSGMVRPGIPSSSQDN